jgi:hypothetical protein
MKNYTAQQITKHFDSVCEIDRENHCNMMAMAHQNHRFEINNAEYAGGYGNILAARKIADEKLQSAIDAVIFELMSAPITQ